MAGFRPFRRIVLVCTSICLVAAFPVLAQKQQIDLTPSAVVAGSPELLRVQAPSAEYVVGHWLGPVIEFFPSQDRRAWYALIGVDVEASTGPSTLHILVHTAQGDTSLDRDIAILPAHYRTTTLTVAPRFVSPSPDELKIIEADKQLKDKIFSASADSPLWRGSFRAPVRAAATDSFGTRRTFNGKLDSIHKGMDYRARMGTLVRASNSGVVVLARKLYFEGNIVVIDHGLGLYTMSMHLSRIDVHEGQHVTTGQIIGLSGATGRVTGPHLHWAVRWHNAYLDPAKLLRLDLGTLR
jgi:murein DD-endopeptidase MepM/ murein hydrolase activator NlpD